MGADQQRPGNNRLPILEFKGLNERKQFVNPELTEFDILQGFVQSKAGTLQRPNGIGPLLYLQGRRILSIKQTFDTRRNVLVQTDNGVLLYSEDEIFSRPSGSNLTPVTPPAGSEEEDMAQGLIVHSVASASNGGSIGSASTWVIRTLTGIAEQFNPDGSAASFITALAANVFTLAAGVYRIHVVSVRSNPNGAGCSAKMRLFNVTTGLPAWNGLEHEESTSIRIQQNTPVLLTTEGTLNLAVPTQLRVEEWASAICNNTGMGFPSNTLKPEVYCRVKVLKTQ